MEANSKHYKIDKKRKRKIGEEVESSIKNV